MREIRAFARRIAEEFKPRRIILFGSYAYGKPTRDSDVDLMVVMPHQGDYVRKAIEIRLRIDAPFPLDLLVRSGRELRERYRLEDWFIREIVDKGKVLYEAPHR
jgi:predicted nucleotidyltransferase